MAQLEILLLTFIRVYILEITVVLNYFTVTLCTFRDFPLSFDFLKTFLVWVHGKSGRHCIGAREGAVLYVLQCRVSTERNFVFSGFSFIYITSVKWKGFKRGQNVWVALIPVRGSHYKTWFTDWTFFDWVRLLELRGLSDWRLQVSKEASLLSSQSDYVSIKWNNHCIRVTYQNAENEWRQRKKQTSATNPFAFFVVQPNVARCATFRLTANPICSHIIVYLSVALFYQSQFMLIS